MNWSKDRDAEIQKLKSEVARVVKKYEDDAHTWEARASRLITERDALKAEVERNKITISALQRSLDVVGKSWNEMDEMWTRERQRSARLVVALESIAALHIPKANQETYWRQLEHERLVEVTTKDTWIAREALLAAKQDETS